MSGVFQLMNQQFPTMFKSPPGENTLNSPARLSGVSGQKVVCTPEVSLYQYPNPVGAQVAPKEGNSFTKIMEDIIEPGKVGLTDIPNGTPTIGGGFQCGFCGKTFQQKNTFQNHLRSHREGDDPYQCDICGKTFAVPARLTRHYRTHTGEKPYQCEYCNKSFSVKENLSVHRRIHTKERPYKCEVCERAFEHSGKLHRHMRIHTGERPHRCQICQKTFIQSGQLVIHMRTHTGEKPYVCKVCGKGFTCSKQLKVHTRTHTGEKPYTCDICGKSFGYNHVLKLHQVAHYGEKVYKCTLCNGTFNSKKALETHIKTHSDDHVPQGPISPNTATESRVMSPSSVSQATPQSQNSDKENRECSDSELSSQNSPSSSNDGAKTPPSPAAMFSSSSTSGAPLTSEGAHHRPLHLSTGSEPKVHLGSPAGGFSNRSSNVSNNVNQSTFDPATISASNSNSSSSDKTCSSLPIPYPMLPPGVQIQQAPHSRTTFLYVTSKLPPHPALNNASSNPSSRPGDSPPVSPPLNSVVRQSHLSPSNNVSNFVGNNISSKMYMGNTNQKGGNGNANVNVNNNVGELNANSRDKMLMYSIREKVLAFTEQFGYGLGPGEQPPNNTTTPQQHAQTQKRFIEGGNGNARYHRDSSSSSSSSNGAISVHPIMVPENLSFSNNNSKHFSDDQSSSYHQNRLRYHQQLLRQRERSSSPEIIHEQVSPRPATTSYAPSGVLALALTKGSKAAANLTAAASHNIPAKVSLIPVNMTNNSSTLFNGYHQQRLSPRSSSPGSPIDFHQQVNYQQNPLYRDSASPARTSLHSPSPNSTPRSTPSLQEDYSDQDQMMKLQSNQELSSDENSSTSNSSMGTKRARSPASNSSGGGPRKRSSLILEKYAMENPASPATPPSSESILSQRLRLSSVIQYAEKCS